MRRIVTNGHDTSQIFLSTHGKYDFCDSQHEGHGKGLVVVALTSRWQMMYCPCDKIDCQWWLWCPMKMIVTCYDVVNLLSSLLFYPIRLLGHYPKQWGKWLIGCLDNFEKVKALSTTDQSVSEYGINLHSHGCIKHFYEGCHETMKSGRTLHISYCCRSLVVCCVNVHKALNRYMRPPHSV